MQDQPESLDDQTYLRSLEVHASVSRHVGSSRGHQCASGAWNMREKRDSPQCRRTSGWILYETTVFFENDTRVYFQVTILRLVDGKDRDPI